MTEHMKQMDHKEDREYIFKGNIESGNMLGRTMGIPTINIPLAPDTDRTHVPAFGVYAANVIFPDGNCYNGVANIGVKPTVDYIKGPSPAGIEVNLFDYGEKSGTESHEGTVVVKLFHFIREERRFENVDELKKQIMSDIDAAKDILGLNNDSCVPNYPLS